MHITPDAHQNAQELLNFIDVSPSPWHAVTTLETKLSAAGFQKLREQNPWLLRSGGQYYVIRGGSSLIGFIVGERADLGFRMVGAHTDSPGLRLKPRATHAADHMIRLGIEVYGGPILATFADRDLSLAGRIHYRQGASIEARLIRFPRALLRLPNLAIHMNRNVNEEGLKFNKQTELPLLLSNLTDAFSPEEQFLSLLADQADIDPSSILSWELNVYDTQPGAFWGAHQEFLADCQLDNLASCHAGLMALLSTQQPQFTCLCGFFDHEEIGSETAQGASGSFLADVAERITRSLASDWETYKRALSASFLVSADMAHAYQPNFPAAYEPQHKIQVNAGPVLKTNVNQRYATSADSQAHFIALCEQVGVPYQQYSHRTDLGCGSTIGPMISARLGIRTVDVGNPMWAMHSVRESAGVLDHTSMISVLCAFFAERSDLIG